MGRRVTLLTALLAMAGPLAAQSLSRLEFMSGCWEGTLGKDQTVEENWTTPTDNLMLGVARYFKAKQATSYEFTAIERTDSVTYVISMPKGEKPDTFRLKTLANEVAAWEREGDTFPGRIMYRLVSNGSLIVRLEAPPAVAQPSVEVRMTRVKCPTG